VSQGRATVEAQAWDAELAAMPNPHLLQSYRWGELQSRFGWEVHRRQIEVDGVSVPVSVLTTPTLVPGGRRGYVGKGPALAADRIDAALPPLAAMAQELDLAFITIEPEIEAGWTPPGPWQPATATQPEHTAIVDLRPEADAKDCGLGILRRESCAGFAGQVRRHGGDSDADYIHSEATRRCGIAGRSGRAIPARHYLASHRERSRRTHSYRTDLH